ncbi:MULTISPECIES: sodium/glutamate symporter [Hyphomicrobiales]|uniref:sodium/glutamate symporter n=1 Tax=Hyphomicrobiales TaxID=356 RepID=UPI000DD9E452|nr:MULTISPECIES: sodium/glutamate symporter [Hyphomicrobiales]KAB2722553.1 sodium/glutamate symporter [Brucella intermedia]KAB2774223.1 sodium/glutamate symporter [Brucella anthropi]
MQVDAFYTFTIAVVLLLAGKIVILNTPVLQKYSIPEPVIGGLVCTIVVALVYAAFERKIIFDLGMRDVLLLLFFAGIGLKADIKTLMTGGRPLAILLSLAIVFMLIQNVAGMSMASLFGLEPRAGLMVGSISLTGGIGTTLAWAPIFVERLGIANAMELGVAGNTIGLIAACMIGGPVAAFLIKRHRIIATHEADLDIGSSNDGRQSRLDYFCVLWAILALNLALILGLGISRVLALTGLNLPAFVSCLLAGILIRNLLPIAVSSRVLRLWPGVEDGLALVSDLALGLFLTMALMGLQLWQLDGVFVFVACTMAVQIALAVMFTMAIVFRLMGSDYEAVVMSAGFGGIALGSTATAIANMTAVTQQYGAAHRAFIVVPLVCGFFIDIVNALIISAFVG